MLFLQQIVKQHNSKQILMKKKISVILIIACLMLPAGCENGIRGAKNLADCEYNFKSVTELVIVDMDVSNGVTPMQALTITELLLNPPSSIPLKFTVNVEVYNPNSSFAGFEKMEYIIHIDGVEFARDRYTERFRVNAGETGVLSVPVKLDVVDLFSAGQQQATINTIKNLVGITSEKTEVRLQLKPTIVVEGISITSPKYIPVNFSFGGN